MKDKRKQLVLCVIAVLVVVGLIVGAVLGSKTPPTNEKNLYQIEILKSAHGTVTASKLEAYEGDKIELTVTPDEGYELSSLTVNGKESETTFTMPAEDVKVLAKFVRIVEDEESDLGGDNFGSAGGYVTTGGIDFSNDKGETPYLSVIEGGPQYAYMKDVFTESLMFEASFKVKEIFNEDQYPKFGIMLNGATEMVKFYVDLKPDLTCESVGVVRQLAGGEDDWANAYTKSIPKINLGSMKVRTGGIPAVSNSIKLKVVRDGKNFYFYVNDILVLCESNVLSEEKTAAGIFSFNTGVDVFNYRCETGEKVKTEISQAEKDSNALVGSFFGKTDSFASSDVIDFATDHGSNPYLILDTKKGTPLYAYINELASKQFYFETEIKASDILSEEKFPKLGIMIRDSKEMVKFYLDMNQEKQVGQIGVVHQLTGKEDDWANQSVRMLRKKLDLNKDTVKVALLRNGTAYYLYVNDELIISGNDLTSKDGAVGVFSFDTTLTCSNYKLVKNGSEYDALLKEARKEAETLDTFKLTLNYFTQTENGLYVLTTNSADESKVDDVMLKGAIFKESYYSVKGKLTLKAEKDWAQSRILISADPKHEYVIALEQTGEDKYQIFTMSKNDEDNWNDWKLISSAALNGNKNSIDFEVIVNAKNIYFLIDDEICYSSSRVSMTESTIKFSGYNNATTTVENLDGQIFANKNEVDAYLETKDEKSFETEYEERINALYKEYITDNGCKGGTLILGSSTIDFWDNWEVQSGLTNYENGYNIGIAGSTTEDWLYAYDRLIKPFSAKRFVISLGEADVIGWGEDGVLVAARLKELLEKIHTDFPNAEIYYVYANPTPDVYKDGKYTNAKYDAFVKEAKEVCKSLDYVQMLDASSVLLVKDKKNVNDALFLDDKRNLNENGYKVWSDYLYDQIFKGETFGVTIGDGVYYKTTNGIELITDNGTGAVVDFFGKAPRYAYLNNTYTNKFYFETDVYLEDLLEDNYPKFGLLINGKTEMVKFYLDVNKDNKQVAQIGVVHQLTGKEDDWANQQVQVLETPIDLSQNSVKIALLRDGKTYYFYVNDKLVITREDLTAENGAVGVFSFNSVMTLNDYKLVAEGNEYKELLSEAKKDADEYWSYDLTTNYFAESQKDIYTLVTDSADESKVDDVKYTGVVLRKQYYYVKGTLTLDAKEDWAQSRILVSADSKHEYMIALEQTGADKYQIFTMSKNNEDSWNDWRLIESAALNGDRNSIDFEVIVNGNKFYFLINGEICYSSSRVDMTESTVKFSGYKKATTTVEALDGKVYANEADVKAYIETKSAKAYKTEFENRINELYQDYITNHECDESRGTLILGSSYVDFWNNWEAQSGLVNYVDGYNVGIAGSTTKDWLYAYDKLIKPFEAERIIISLGEADVSVWGEDGIAVVERLEALFEKIHADYPNTKIYYLYPLPTPNGYQAGVYTNTKYASLIREAKALCESLTYVEGIDSFDVFTTSDKQNVKDNLFLDNKTYLNDNGYQVWSEHLYNEIFKGETFGVTVGDGIVYKTSNGIELLRDYGDNAKVFIFGTAPRYAYVNDLFADKYYFETRVELNNLLADAYPKLGLFVNGNTEMVKFYLDINKDNQQVTQVGVVHQPTGGEDLWGEQKVHTLEKPLDLKQKSVKLALLRNGKTYYFYVNDELVATADGLTAENGAVGVFSFNAVMTLTDYSVVTEGAKYDTLREKALKDATRYWSYYLTQNHFSEVADGKYELITDSADEGKIDDIRHAGNVLREKFYSIKGKLTLSANEDWAQSRILVSSDARHEYMFVLEQTGTNSYQIFTMSKNNEDNWNDWKLIASAGLNGNRNSIDFEVVVNEDKVYLLINDKIWYSSNRAAMTESTVKFAGYKNAKTTVENLVGQIFADATAVNTYLATKNEKPYETEYEGQINALYQEYITEHGCANKGGTLLLGDSFANIWANWQEDTGLINYVDGYNVAIQGSTTKDWLYAYDKLVKPFAADRFVIALGNADIVTWNANRAEVISRLAELFEKINFDHPNAEIYYIYAVPASFVSEVNDLCESLNYVEGINTTEDVYDKIFAGENFGATVKTDGTYKTTAGISLKNDKGNNPTLDFWREGQLFAYLKNTYTKKAYFETQINVSAVLGNDAFPKFGLVLQGKSEKVSFFVDMTPDMTANTVGVVRQKTGGVYDWDNARSVNVNNLSFTGQNTVKLAVVRDGRAYYFYVNDTLVLYEKDGLYNEDGAIGIFSFNTALTASNYKLYTGDAANSYITDAQQKTTFFGSANGLQTSTGVDLSEDYAANIGKVVVNTGGTKHLYVRDSYFIDYYFETKVHVNEIFNNDGYPKFGLFAEDGATRISFFVDMRTDKISGTVGRVISTHNGTSWSDDWGGVQSVSVEGMSFSGDGEYVTLGLKKEGNRFFFYVNGNYVMSYDCDDLSGKSTVGVFGFNTGMELKNYFINQVEGINSMVTLKTEGSFGTVAIGEKIWTDKGHTFYDMPTAFLGSTYIKNAMKTEIQFDVKKSGYMYILTPPGDESNSIANKLEPTLYTRIETPSWYFASYTQKRDTWVYERKIEKGETVMLPSGDYWHMVVVSELPIDPTVHEISKGSAGDGTGVFSTSGLAVLEPTNGTIVTVACGEYVFSNRVSDSNKVVFNSTFIPYGMRKNAFIFNNLNAAVNATVTKSGTILVLASDEKTKGLERKEYLKENGFTYVGSVKEYKGETLHILTNTDNSYTTNGYGLYIKKVNAGDTVSLNPGFWMVTMFQGSETLPQEPIVETNNSATMETVELGKQIWNDKPEYVFTSLPKDFIGKKYVKAAYSGSETVDVTVVRPGYIYVLTNAYKQSNSQGEKVEELNYSKVDIPGWKFCNFPESSLDGYTWVYEKYVEPGETLKLDQWSVVIASEERVDFSMPEDYIVPDEDMAVVESLSNQPSGTMELGSQVFTTWTKYVFYDMPYWLAGKNYIISDYNNGGTLKVTREGVLYMLTNNQDDRKTYFEGLGFEKVETPAFEPFGGSSQGGTFPTKGYAIYKKSVEVGDEITWNKWAIPIYSGDFVLSDNLAMIQADSETTLTSKWEYHARLFNDRNFYEVGGSPEALYGLSYLYAGIDNDGGSTAKGTVTKAGTIYVQIPVKTDNNTYKALQAQLIADGFTQTPYRIYRNNERLGYAQRLYQKEVQVGDVINYGKYHFVFFDTLENEANYYVMPSLTKPATIINNPMNNANYDYVDVFSERNWQGCPVITRTNSGRLWAGWFTGGVTELATKNHAVLLYSDDNGKTWVDPAVAIVPSDLAYQVTKPQVWTLEDGRLWVSWTQHTGTSGFDGRMSTWAAICENPDAAPEDLRWTTPIRLFDGRGNGKITVLKKEDGTEEWLTTAFDWMDRNYSKVYSSVDKGKTWTFKGMAEVTGSTYNNAILVERKDDNGNSYLWMLLRQLEGNMKESFSYDGGKTWTNATKSHIEHPNSAIYVGYTSSGKLLMINHKDFTGRNNLTAFLSEDGGLTWEYSLLLDARSGVSYPDVVEGSDGTLYIVYDYDRFKTGQMYMTTITEEDIMAGDYVSAVAKKKILFSSLGINGAQVPDSLEKIDLTGKNSWASSDSGSGTNVAFDSNTDTRWCASGSALPQWLTIDLGQEYNLGAIYIFFEQRSNWDYTLEVSTDGENWNVYAQPGPKKLVDVTELKDARARYVRLTINGTSGGAWASIWEMEIYSHK